MKKRVIAAAVSLAMMGTMAFPVSAAEMSVVYRQPNAYTVTIPASVSLSKDEVATQSVGVKDVNLEPNTEIKMNISSGITSEGVVELVRDKDDTTKVKTIVSTTPGGTSIISGVDFVTFTKDDEQTLYFSAVTPLDDSENIKAGNYKGTIIFVVTAPDKQ